MSLRLRLRDRVLELRVGEPLVMGIVNASPESFSDGSRVGDLDTQVELALRLREVGADLIDVGGESGVTDRPPIDPAEEAARVVPLVERLAAAGVAVSVDTWKAGVANASFLKGTIEAIPLPDASVDVVISNCVINLAADKHAVLREARRVLRPGGRFAVADMVALAELPADVKRSLDQWAGCVAGTISVDEYAAALRDAGFNGIAVEVTREVRLEGVDGAIASAYIRATA